MILIAIVSACLTLFLNYIIGKPGSEFSPYEIFSSYTVWLSKMRLRKLSLLKQYDRGFQQNLNRTEKQHEYLSLKKDYNKILYQAAEPFFTWERMVGMCSVCTGFWISLLAAILFSQNIVHLIAIIVISHIIIRILNKLL